MWALREYGFHAILAESFADIFCANCIQNGLLPVPLGAGEMRELFARCQRAGGPYDLVVDLEARTVADEHGFHATFTIDPYRREMLLRGLDEIGRTLLAEERIAEFERGRRNAERGTEERAWGSGRELESPPAVPRSHFRVPRSGEGGAA